MENEIVERVTDSTVKLAHLTHQVAKAKVLLEDVMEDGKHKAERTIKRGMLAAEDCLVDTTYCIKRHPWEAVGVALGAGAGLGLILGWMATKNRSEH